MNTTWPEAVLCLGLTALVCGTLLRVAWMASRSKQ